jgi:hypothetical protein
MTNGRLPVRLEPVLGESLSSFVQRLAVANDVAPSYILGVARDAVVRWRYRDSVLSRVAGLSDVSVDDLRLLTVEGIYPEWASTQSVVGLGRVGRPVYCPVCSPSTSGEWTGSFHCRSHVATAGYSCASCVLVIFGRLAGGRLRRR